MNVATSYLNKMTQWNVWKVRYNVPFPSAKARNDLIEWRRRDGERNLSSIIVRTSNSSKTVIRIRDNKNLYNRKLAKLR